MQTIVADYSQEYQWAQKNFRGLYIEEKAEEAQDVAFPTALLSGDLDEAIANTLYKRGFTPENTILAHSVCSDEVNNKDEQLVALMVNRWQEGEFLSINITPVAKNVQQFICLWQRCMPCPDSIALHNEDSMAEECGGRTYEFEDIL